MAVNDWWASEPSEIYFMETTDRHDIGVDLRSPAADDAGRVHHGHALMPFVRRGDVVFHYRRQHGIVAWSRAAGSVFDHPIVWGARGSAAKLPYEQPGWRVPLEGPFNLPQPVSLNLLREREPSIRAAIESTELSHPRPIYRPFELSKKQRLGATQHYLTKLPRAVVLAVPELREAVDAGNGTNPAFASQPVGPGGPSVQEELGQRYVIADEEASTSKRDPFTIDPAVVDRGVQGHATTQNALAAFIESRGWTPRSPRAREPQYDLAWREPTGLGVAEVKSLTRKNEEQQLRLGLGQVLRYRQVLMTVSASVRAVLAVERKPSDASWPKLCRSLGVVLCWPPEFEGL